MPACGSAGNFGGKSCQTIAIGDWDDVVHFDSLVFDHDKKQATVTARTWNGDKGEWTTETFKIDSRGNRIKEIQ